MESYANIAVETQRPEIVRVVIRREKSLNALNRATLGELALVLDRLSEAVRVVILTGAGDKAFVAGADISEMQAMSPAEAAAFSRLGHKVLARLETIDPVVIAEVNGYALGGGCELMLACDFAIASANAKLGQPEVALGVTAGFGGTVRLSRRAGEARARQLLYTGAQLGAQEALSMGLVNEVVQPAELRARVDAIADKIVQNGPAAVKATKRAIRVGTDADFASALTFEQNAFALCFATEDQKEGMTAFIEKRKPVWTGR